MPVKPKEKEYYIGFEDVGAIEIRVSAPTEKQAKERAKEVWKKHPDNKPKVVYCIETGRKV
jgi:hypothetical protein